MCCFCTLAVCLDSHSHLSSLCRNIYILKFYYRFHLSAVGSGKLFIKTVIICRHFYAVFYQMGRILRLLFNFFNFMRFLSCTCYLKSVLIWLYTVSKFIHLLLVCIFLIYIFLFLLSTLNITQNGKEPTIT